MEKTSKISLEEATELILDDVSANTDIVATVEQVLSYLKMDPDPNTETGKKVKEIINDIFLTLSECLFKYFMSAVTTVESCKTLIPQYIVIWSTIFYKIFDTYPSIKDFVGKTDDGYFDSIYHVFVVRCIYAAISTLQEFPENVLQRKIIDVFGENCPDIVAETTDRYVEHNKTV